MSDGREAACVALWAAVLLQALDDLERMPYCSLEFREAEDFLLGGGEWAKSRAEVGLLIDIPADRITAKGQSVLQRRQKTDPRPLASERPAVVRRLTAQEEERLRPAQEQQPRLPVVRRLDPRPSKVWVGRPERLAGVRSNAWLQGFLTSGSRGGDAP